MEGQIACRTDGGTLASIASAQENDRLSEELKDYPRLNAWIGLSASGGSYSWNDGSVYNYSNFDSGFPNEARGSCVAMSGTPGTSFGKWQNVDCAATTGQAFFCRNEPVGGIANVANGCPAARYAQYGYFASSAWPNNYGNNLNCTYTVTTFLGCRPNIFFTDFLTEQCCDFVYIYDGPSITSPLISRLSGSSPTGQFYNATTHTMTIQFRSDPANNFRGFQANYGYCCDDNFEGAEKSLHEYCFTDQGPRTGGRNPKSSTRNKNSPKPRQPSPEHLAKVFGAGYHA